MLVKDMFGPHGSLNFSCISFDIPKSITHLIQSIHRSTLPDNSDVSS